MLITICDVGTYCDLTTFLDVYVYRPTSHFDRNILILYPI
jgi:hypothetical protein